MEKTKTYDLDLLDHRSAIVNALNSAVDIFTSHSDKEFDDVISKGIKPIADAVKLDRVVFYRRCIVDEEIRFKQIYRWDKAAKGLIPIGEEQQIMPKIPVLEQWFSVLSKGDYIKIREANMSKDELAFLLDHSIKSLLIIPIFSHGEFWGGVSLQDHTNNNYFDEGCIDLLFSVARLCANAIIRAEMLFALKRREKMANMLNKMAVTFLSQSQESFEAMMTEGIRLIADMMNLDRVSVWRNFTRADGLHASQIYRWDKESGGTTTPTAVLKDVSYSQFAPSWEGILSNRMTINSPAKLLPEREAAMLKSFGVVSVFVSPVFINNAFWGFVLFEDRRKDRYFEDDLTEIMRSAAFLCANTVLRADMEQKISNALDELEKQSELLKDRLEQQELISEISRSFVSSGETQKLINNAIAKLGHYYKVSRVVVYNMNYQSGDAFLAYHWPADSTFSRRGKININNTLKSSFPERLYEIATVPILSCTDTVSAAIEDFQELLNDDINAFICAPLYVEGNIWGMLAVEQCFSPRQWTNNEKNFVAMTASTIASAITMDIYNTKLKDAVTEIMAASKAKSEFLSNMSHEMRTPMNAIINMTSIAKNTESIERKNYALDKISDASTHLLGVINDILDMSKIEANKFELAPVKFNFEKMLSRVVNVINFRVEEKHQTLNVRIDKNIPKQLVSDDQRLSQIITNLLSNAVKFTPENGVINLNAEFLGEENGICSLQISVTDTGIGISKEHQAHLFQSFQQAETSTARTYGGTGLGLSISKSFVEMMGGTIWVESESGKGSTFAFTIQAEFYHDEEDTEDQSAEKNAPVKRSNDFTGHRILLVEDMEINREIVLMLLEDTNLEIDCAENGIQAVEMFIEEPERYEIIFMDVHMPGMDGYEATQQIRLYEKKLNKTGRTPIIAMTANVFKEDIMHCINSGMDDHLGKPLDLELILEKLHRYLKNAK
ncbi:MAG: ATP-binding protein [Treponema sp.]|nr:ATP-binding protein [Treponema sp.]